MPFFYDSTMLIVIPFAIFAMYAQSKISSTYSKYSKVTSRKGLTGADIARQLLNLAGIYDVTVERVAGNLTDHYDPRAKVLRLSDVVYNSTSIAAIGVAAHETGHAVQHNTSYAPLSIRNAIVPVVNFGSKLSMPLILIGLLFSAGRGGMGIMLLYAGIILFSGVVIFQLITLPVEFNASNRAIDMLEQHNILAADEIPQARKVLNSAALTYVAAAAVSLANLLRLLLLANRRSNRD